MPCVSVVVPVYNVEDYLEKCLRSILTQTYSDLEVLLIDDGSTDRSGGLCEELAQTDPRVRVIHQENQGLGGARNTGIEAAQGEWILFVDSDDWLEADLIADSLEAAERAGADMVVPAFRTVDETGRELAVMREDLPENTGLALARYPQLLLMSPCAWGRLYRTRLFRDSGLRYPPRAWYEDLRTTFKLLPLAERVVAIPTVGVNYLQRAGSIMNSRNLARNVEILEALEDLLDWYQKRGLLDQYRPELEYLALFHGYLTASVRVLRADPKSPLLEEFAGWLRQRFPDYRSSKYLPRLGRKRRLLFRLLEHRQYRAIRLLFRLKG